MRRRFHVVLSDGRLHIETEVDRFAAERPIFVAGDFSGFRFELESGNPAAHRNGVRVAGLPSGGYRVLRGDDEVAAFDVVEGGAVRFEVPVEGTLGSGVLSVVRSS